MSVMKSRHAAALALVGWYLMMPHALPGNPSPDWGAPISDWYRYGDFRSQAACEAKKQRMIELTQDPKARADMEASTRRKQPDLVLKPDYWDRVEEYTMVAKCVPSNDSGFRGNPPPREDHCCGDNLPLNLDGR
jgi:hypothetical protein